LFVYVQDACNVGKEADTEAHVDSHLIQCQ